MQLQTDSKSRQCGSFSEEERETIFNNVWKEMKWDGRKGYVRGLVDVPTSRGRTDADHSRKNTTFRYHLKRDGERKVVCKSMFLSTTGLGRWSVQQWARGLATPTTAAVRSGYYDRAKGAREFMRTGLFQNCHKCLPTTVALPQARFTWNQQCPQWQICTSSTKRNVENTTEPHCHDKFSLTSLRKWIWRSSSLKKKNQCDVCVAHEVGNVTDEVWAEHRQKKDQVKDKKNREKEHAIQYWSAIRVWGYKKTLVACMDSFVVTLFASISTLLQAKPVRACITLLCMTWVPTKPCVMPGMKVKVGCLLVNLLLASLTIWRKIQNMMYSHYFLMVADIRIGTLS